MTMTMAETNNEKEEATEEKKNITKHIFRFVISVGELEIGIPNDIKSITIAVVVVVDVVAASSSSKHAIKLISSYNSCIGKNKFQTIKLINR